MHRYDAQGMRIPRMCRCFEARTDSEKRTVSYPGYVVYNIYIPTLLAADQKRTGGASFDQSDSPHAGIKKDMHKQLHTIAI